MKRCVGFLLFLCLACLTDGATAGHRRPEPTAYRLEPKEFMRIPDRGGEESPIPLDAPDLNRHAVIMAAPRKVFVRVPKGEAKLSDLARLPVVLSCRFLSHSPDLQQIHTGLIILRDERRGTEYRGQEYLQIDGVLTIPWAEANGEPVVVIFSKNLNILDFVELPVEPAVYLVQMVFGSTKTNVCRVEIVLEQ